MEPYIEDEHNFGKVFPIPGPLPVLASRLQYGNMAYRWRITFIIGSHFSSATLHVWGYGLLFTFVTSHPSRPCKRWTAQRSLLSHVSFFLHHLSRVPWSLTASPGCGWYGAPRFLSVARFPGVGWTLLFRSLTVPLLGSVPSCCRCFTLSCLFLVGIAVLADASTAYANVSPYLYVTTQLALCRLMRFVFVTVSYPCQS